MIQDDIMKRQNSSAIDLSHGNHIDNLRVKTDVMNKVNQGSIPFLWQGPSIEATYTRAVP